MSNKQLVILGRTRGGKAFRPSDWADRLCGLMSFFGEDRKMSYSPYVKPVLVDGVRGVLVDGEFEQIDPQAWQFVIQFACDNDLETSEHAAVLPIEPPQHERSVAPAANELPWPVPVDRVPYGPVLASIFTERKSLAKAS